MSAVFQNLLPVSLAVSILISLLLFLSRALERRYTAKWRRFIWLALALRLLVPWGAPIPVPVRAEPAPAVQAARINPELQSAAVPSAQPALHDMKARSPAPRHAQPTQPRQTDLADGLALLWAAGASLCLLRCFGGYALFWRRVRRWGTVCRDGEILKTANRIRRQARIRKRIPLVVCKTVSSPMASGFFFPTLILPEIEYAPEDLSWILRHELMHCKRGDIWYKLLLALACCVHWFNPLVWRMAGAAVRDVEICCDDAVLAKASLDDRAKYSQTILQTAESGERMAFIPQFYTGGQGLILRLRAIFDTHPRRHGAAALTAVILAAAFSGGCFRPVSIPAAEIDETEYVLYESSGTQEKAKKPSSTAAPPDKATEIVAYFLAETHPGAALRSQMGTTEEGESYISCLIFETENLKFLPAEIASARINFIPETNFSAYKSGLLPHTPGEREIRCPLDGWRATASYHPDCGIALAKTMDRLMDGEFLLDASLRLPLELASWHGAFQLFSGDEASEPLHAMTGDGELCAVMLKRFQEARPDSVSETLEKKGAYQLMNLYARNSGGTWKGFSMRFYKTENAVEILALDGSFEKRYTFKKQDAWIACFLEDVTGKLAVLPPAPALSAKAAAEKIVSFARSPELKLGALSGDAAQTGWLMKKSYVEGARQLLLNIQPETLAECDPLSERIGGLQMENNHETIDLWLLDTPVPTVEYAVSGTLTPARHYYALSGGEKPFLVLLNYLQRTNQMLWDSSETVTTEDTDPQRVGRLLFEAYRSSRSSYDTLEEFQMPGATVMGTRLIGGDLNHFAVEIEYRDDADRWAFQVLRGRREDRTQYRLIKLFPERNDFVYSPPVDVATEDKIREAMESLENPDAYHWDNLTDVYAASLLDGVLTGSGRLEGFLWRAAKNESDCLRVLAPPYAYEVWTQENGQGCVIVYQADGSWKRYDTAEPFSLTENGYIIGQTLSGPGLPLVLPEN